MLSKDHFLFTSESVGEGHPDKLCDLISDSILDECLRQDPLSRVACECVATTGLIFVFGEVNSKAHLDLQTIVRDCVRQVGYDGSEMGFDADTCNVMSALQQQSSEINASVTSPPRAAEDGLGAGDQGLMFGYASDETPELMPLTLMLAHAIVRKCGDLRRSGAIPWLRPDCKSQVTVEYRMDGGACVPLRVHTVVLSCQHSPSIVMDDLRCALLDQVIANVIPGHLLDDLTIYHIQPSGSFTVGGPKGDAGLTGRKIIVDTFGGWGAHGGGAFSGKDWTKVDRSAAYAARWIAKSVVGSGLARRCLLQLSYSIGLSKPLSIHVDCYGTERVGCRQIERLIMESFDLRPSSICQALGLDKPIFKATACYGHFGNSEFPWEQIKKLGTNQEQK